MTVDYRRLANTSARIVKGLFAHSFRRRLPETHAINIMFTELQKDMSAIDDPQIKELISMLGQSGVHHESNETIDSWVKLAEDDENASFWYIRVCKTIGFFAFTSPKDD